MRRRVPGRRPGPRAKDHRACRRHSVDMTLPQEKKVNMIKDSMARKATSQKKAPIWIGGETTVARITGQVAALLEVRVTGVALAGTRVVAAATIRLELLSVMGRVTLALTRQNISCNSARYAPRKNMSKRLCHLPEHLLEAAVVESSAYGFSLVSPLLLLSMNRSGFEVNMPCYGGINQAGFYNSV